MESDRYIRQIKPCVKELLDGVNGYPKHSNWHISPQKRAAYLIALELKRVGCPKELTRDILLGWNESKNNPPIPKPKPHIIDLVPWVYRHPGELGCKGLLKEGGPTLGGNWFEPICFLDIGRSCNYQGAYRDRNIADDPPDLKQYLTLNWTHYFEETRGIVADGVYRILAEVETERGFEPGAIVYISVEVTLARYLSKKPKQTAGKKTIYNAIRRLETEGLIEITERGTFGTKRTERRANGYRRILPIPEPPEVSKVHTS